MKIKCVDCEAFHKDKTSEYGGYCCRRPPVADTECHNAAVFPRVNIYTWCMAGVKKKEQTPVGFKFVDAPNGDVMCVDKTEEAQ